MAPGQAARAWEAFEGRVQVHGFVEEQVRVLDGSFNEEADLAQWYNVLTLENEFDIAPNGFGPIDLLQAYVRIEARYDCVWTHGCGMFDSVNTYGNDAKRLPQRLRDAKDQDYGGVIATGTPTVPHEVTRISNDRPAPWAVLRVIRNEPVGGTVPAQWTPDQALFNNTWIKNTCQVPPGIGFQPTCAFGPGPWNREFITIVEDRQGFPGLDTLFRTRGADAELGANQDTGVNDDPANYTFEPVLNHLWALRSKKGPDGGAGRTMVMGPWLPKNSIRSLGTLSDRANPFRGITPPVRNGLPLVPGVQDRRVPSPRTSNFPAPLVGAPYPTTDPNGDTLDQRIVDFFLDPVNGYNLPMSRFPAVELNAAMAPIDGTGFGGDFNGIVPHLTPEVNFSSDAQKLIRNDPTLPFSRKVGAFPGTNVRATGGTTELPARPAPDKGNQERFDGQVAQGLYLPSSNLRRALREQDYDNPEMQFTETELSWNHGQSQQDTYEVKEAYVDVEVLDSRLWGRFGLQNIVWGKTELFRTTDQFNPQDLALASLASLEESRIALFAGRLVYSLYDVGPLEDVRAEFAFNFDDYQPADLGVCGEPFTPDPVCGISAGLYFHGVTGVGIIGIDRPPNPWDSIKGLEIGGRLEWRWDRFSFALMDFWGYGDFPFPDATNYYERNVDPETGRPLIAGSRGSCATAGVFLVPDGSPGTPLPSGPGVPAGFSVRSLADPQVNQAMQGGLGMGVDPDCLKAGGADGGLNENHWDPADYAALRAWLADPTNNPFPILYDGLGSPENALENHSANQQIFAWICSGTVTIAAAVDPGACAWSIFTTGAPLNAATPFLPLSEALGAVFAGEHDDGAQIYFATFTQNTKGFPVIFTPVRNLNDDFNDGIITALNPAINPNTNFFGIQIDDFLTLDSTLTNEQRALIGCGPFFSTRCDSGRGGQAVNTVVPGSPPINYQGQGWDVGGGMDVLNAEASAILQAFPGFEGTATVGLNGLASKRTPWTTTNQDLTQPGTIGFQGGPVCTRNVRGQIVILPGCRGVQSLELEAGGAAYRAVFENGYNVGQDGCVFGVEDGSAANIPVSLNGKPINAVHADGSAVDLSTCGTGPVLAQTTQASHTRDADPGQLGYGTFSTNMTHYLFGARTLFHPLAGCLTAAQAAASTPCLFQNRDFNAEFGAGTAQIFRNEMAAFSWNLMMFLITAGSCDQDERAIQDDPACFFPNNAWSPDKCGFAAPHLCDSVRGFLGVGGPNSPKRVAGGNKQFGRRDFLWHSGGELALRYPKRNVFGLSTDFAEDVSKTNWSLEFTWIGATPYTDNGDFGNGLTDSDSINLTVSIDRPTFINFLNANRTIFFNTQWFFQYLTGYESTFTSNGPFNVLFTFAMFTGYFQDRLLPTVVTVYDFGSRSGGFLPSITYRFNEAFSVTTGVNWFWGRGQYKDMPVRAFAPTSNRAGNHAYDDGVENVLSAINRRDEIFLRLRYTF
jgi:hypothetical protein